MNRERVTYIDGRQDLLVGLQLAFGVSFHFFSEDMVGLGGLGSPGEEQQSHGKCLHLLVVKLLKVFAKKVVAYEVVVISWNSFINNLKTKECRI